MYFECNIPKRIPQYYHPAIYQQLADTVALIHERTEKLNMALDNCILPGCATREATFAKIARGIFNFDKEHPGELFDRLTPVELANLASSLYDGIDAEDRIEWPIAIVAFDAAFVTTKDWESLRHIGIGGSDSSVLMGVNPYQTEEGLWYEKLGYPEFISEESRRSLTGAIFSKIRSLKPSAGSLEPGASLRQGCLSAGHIPTQLRISTPFS